MIFIIGGAFVFLEKNKTYHRGTETQRKPKSLNHKGHKGAQREIQLPRRRQILTTDSTDDADSKLGHCGFAGMIADSGKNKISPLIFTMTLIRNRDIGASGHQKNKSFTTKEHGENAEKESPGLKQEPTTEKSKN